MPEVDLPPLTPDQAAQAAALYRHLLALRRSGVREALIRLDDELGVRAVGTRVNVALTKHAKIATASN